MLIMTCSSCSIGNVEGFVIITARRKLPASVAYGKQVEGDLEQGLLSTCRNRRELERKQEKFGTKEQIPLKSYAFLALNEDPRGVVFATLSFMCLLSLGCLDK